ncbi:MAG: Hsp20/alpha crystallin family protein [Chlamydiales bacterium]
MSLIPNWFARFPTLRQGASSDLRKFFEDLENEVHPSGLSISSDEEKIYVEANVPGLTSKDVEVTIDPDNVLWIKGEKKVEETSKKKKFYRRSQSSFSYCIPLWEEIDPVAEPEAVCKDGVMRVVFSKKKEKQIAAKKITVKE